MKRRDGRRRKTPESVSAPADKKNSVGVRRLRSCAIRRRVEQTLMHVLAGALLLPFPESTVKDTARFVMKEAVAGPSREIIALKQENARLKNPVAEEALVIDRLRELNEVVTRGKKASRRRSGQ